MSEPKVYGRRRLAIGLAIQGDLTEIGTVRAKTPRGAVLGVVWVLIVAAFLLVWGMIWEVVSPSPTGPEDD